MEKLFTLFLLSNALIFTDNNDNKPNQPVIHNPLPLEALKYIFDEYSQDFPKDLSSPDAQKFYTFLMLRAQAAETDQETIIKNEGILLDNLITNYHSNRPNLSSNTLAMCAFADSLIKLRTHQLIAEYEVYPREQPLAPFEQNYRFKLFPVPDHVFIITIASMPANQTNHILGTINKRWISFLLHRLTRK